MKNLSKLSDNIKNLISANSDLNKKNAKLEEKIARLEKDLKFLEGKNQEIPDVILKNKRLLDERKKLSAKIDSVLKNLEDIKV
jgi:chromosome segregation ATPase